VDATRRLAYTVAARIEAGALDDGGSLEALAEEFGLSSRQLRRAVHKELGVSPVELAQTHRLLLAKQLLTETRLPIIEVAFASGFASLRRFNALFRSHYRLTPRQLRRLGSGASGEGVVRLHLAYRPPLAWSEMLDFLAGRGLAGVECVRGCSYLRTVALGKHRGWLRVEPAKGKDALVVELATALVPVLPAVLARLRNLFDLNARPDVIVSHLAADARVGPAVRRCPGLRVPGAFDGFELAVRAVLGQQVSVRAATTTAGRLAAWFGQPMETPIPGLDRLGPTPERLADADTTALTRLGIPSRRAETIRAVAKALLAGQLSLVPGPAPEEMIQRLVQLPGIGEWTAHYIAMRAARWPDAFPHDDLGLRKGIGEASAARLRRVADAWRPWRAYAAMHIWHALSQINQEEAVRA
jgi:AraC family transcriptional regulator of adaptative response / DNA-3-methyladenine glycosylase II